ncbi:hypothetical protein HK103_002573 [Boothiomyces macroporosus]|uniref:N-acetyltransferase domain-containing protein n=1 Tax=Boothiomyces macroporosus TaxID=261099 RepID=A0AAD5Y4B4_9FUNG|nr:hypothetical protein HK103_002573 [Boothiomyces macroporosus]
MFKVDENTFLRKYRDSDDVELSKELADEEVTRYTTIPHPYTLQHAKTFISENKNLVGLFAIVQEDKVVGAIEYDQQKGCFAHKAIIGYWLKKGLWNQGIMKNALATLIKIVEKQNETAEIKIKRLEAHVCNGNEFSGRTLMRNGFEKEGILVKDFCKNNVYYDTTIYGKILE